MYFADFFYLFLLLGDVDSCDDNESVQDNKNLNYSISSNKQRQVTNFDLLNGHALPPQRSSRFRIYPNGFRPYVAGPKHETKL